MTLQKAGLLNDKLPKINPISLYSSKGKCVQIFDDFIKLMNPANEEGREPTGEEITKNLESNELIMSAFEKMMLYDCVCQMQTTTSFVTGHQADMACLMASIFGTLSPRRSISLTRGGWYPDHCAGQCRGTYQSPFFYPKRTIHIDHHLAGHERCGCRSAHGFSVL